jgi:hypothetical protein
MRSLVIASNASTTDRIRESSGISRPSARAGSRARPSAHGGRGCIPQPRQIKIVLRNAEADLRVFFHLVPFFVRQRAGFCKTLSLTPILPISWSIAKSAISSSSLGKRREFTDLRAVLLQPFGMFFGFFALCRKRGKQSVDNAVSEALLNHEFAPYVHCSACRKVS